MKRNDDPDIAWNELRKACVERRHRSEYLEPIDLCWDRKGDYRADPDVLVLLKPWVNQYSKHLWLDSLQINQKIGCIIYKTRNKTHIPHFTYAEAMWCWERWERCEETKDMKYVDPIIFCPVCRPMYAWDHGDLTFNPLWKKREDEDHWTSHEFVCYYGTSQIYTQAYDPSNPPDVIRHILNAPRFDQPVLMTVCGRSVECPGFDSKLIGRLAKKSKASTRNFFKLMHATAQISKLQTEKLKH